MYYRVVVSLVLGYQQYQSTTRPQVPPVPVPGYQPVPGTTNTISRPAPTTGASIRPREPLHETRPVSSHSDRRTPAIQLFYGEGKCFSLFLWEASYRGCSTHNFRLEDFYTKMLLLHTRKSLYNQRLGGFQEGIFPSDTCTCVQTTRLNSDH